MSDWAIVFSVPGGPLPEPLLYCPDHPVATLITVDGAYALAEEWVAEFGYKCSVDGREPSAA